MTPLKKVLKKMYMIMPFKRAFFFLLKLFWSPPKFVYQHLYFNGTFRVKVDNQSFLFSNYNSEIETDVFWSGLGGNWEKNSLSVWTRLSKNSEIIFDIGANTGIYSLISKAVNPNAKIYSFEPVHRIYNKLKNNCSINNFHISLNELALSDRDGRALLYDLPLEHHYLASLSKEELLINKGDIKKEDIREVEIKTEKMSTFILNNNISRIDLMKIDVEDHEIQVLSGMEKYLRSFSPDILIELKNDDKAEQLADLVRDTRYLFFDIDEKNGITRIPRLRKSTNWNFLICKQRTAEYLKLI